MGNKEASYLTNNNQPVKKLAIKVFIGCKKP